MLSCSVSPPIHCSCACFPHRLQPPTHGRSQPSQECCTSQWPSPGSRSPLTSSWSRRTLTLRVLQIWTVDPGPRASRRLCCSSCSSSEAGSSLCHCWRRSVRAWHFPSAPHSALCPQSSTLFPEGSIQDWEKPLPASAHEGTQPLFLESSEIKGEEDVHPRRNTDFPLPFYSPTVSSGLESLQTDGSLDSDRVEPSSAWAHSAEL